ncbi:hypothetical protein O3P69_014602 [Scylla paramamosain]|uniref:Uncharacterized protein n=1 Tax=Scylla paramamosain TaxID=85552 RepID=A0AAW0U0E9_SCYPA
MGELTGVLGAMREQQVAEQWATGTGATGEWMRLLGVHCALRSPARSGSPARVFFKLSVQGGGASMPRSSCVSRGPAVLHAASQDEGPGGASGDAVGGAAAGGGGGSFPTGAGVQECIALGYRMWHVLLS